MIYYYCYFTITKQLAKLTINAGKNAILTVLTFARFRSDWLKNHKATSMTLESHKSFQTIVWCGAKTPTSPPRQPPPPPIPLPPGTLSSSVDVFSLWKGLLTRVMW